LAEFLMSITEAQPKTDYSVLSTAQSWAKKYQEEIKKARDFLKKYSRGRN